MATFNKGDIVQLRSSVEAGDVFTLRDGTEMRIHSGMCEATQQRLIVANYDAYDNTVHVGNGFWYPAEALELADCRETVYKVGDKVRIKKDIKLGPGKNGKKFVVDMMLGYAGREATVTAVKYCLDGTYGYALDVDKGVWTWYNRCLLPSMDWNAFETGASRVFTPTQKAYLRFLKEAEKRGYKWRSGASPTSLPHYFSETIHLSSKPGKRIEYGTISSPEKTDVVWHK